MTTQISSLSLFSPVFFMDFSRMQVAEATEHSCKGVQSFSSGIYLLPRPPTQISSKSSQYFFCIAKDIREGEKMQQTSLFQGAKLENR